MIRALVILCLTMILPFTICQAGGNGVSNGGGFAQCEDLQMYSYDYLLTLNEQNLGPDVLANDLQSSLQRISSQLKRLQDPLAKEFENFISLMFTQTPGAPYQWFERQNLRLMFDPDVVSGLPTTCRVRKQAVYFTAPFLGVPYSAYVYDPQLVQQVSTQKNGALQVSYLWVHEWLWNYFDRADFMKLASFNRLLHSESFQTMSVQEYSKHRNHLSE